LLEIICRHQTLETYYENSSLGGQRPNRMDRLGNLGRWQDVDFLGLLI
jgi:hypothetical protein